ncbi:uncharacterized protein LOC105628569 isoform X2 [Jatropha curcas]|uniref:uncharacterized protein LOC105628569 isoform X2 n=1 Tax=Jatropha curcas TaxID=180498 RepID=UPI0009D67954|nr:uncharacterized protein LOC105628569 isoform X2 [Jatropha curcas]
MGGLLHLFDFNHWHSSMARKILAHKRHVEALEAPRNSLELQVETSQSCCAAGDTVEEEWPERTCYPIEASMKRLINEEISKQSNNRKNTPSIVARLMGVDMLPMDEKSAAQPVDRKNVNIETKYSRKAKNEKSSVAFLSSNSNSTRQTEYDSLYYGRERNVDRWNNGHKLGKLRPREHPQEEELQMFKKEFEAWQAARFKECSKVVEFRSSPDQLLAQENILKQNVLPTAMSTSEKIVEHKGHGLKAKSRERATLHHKHKLEVFPVEQNESSSSRGKNMNKNYKHSSINYDQKVDISSAPTKIVILKPGPDRFGEPEECWTSSSCNLEDRGSIEDFLEEVKERLKCELQGKTVKRGSVVRGSGIETPFSEKPSDPKQIAKHIAQHVRESVTRDLEMNLLRSESTRSYRSEIQFNGAGSPEFINRDTRRFLSERLRNVLKRETHSLDVPLVVSGSSGSSFLNNEKVRLKEVEDTSQAGTLSSYWGIAKDEQEMQTRSFRHGDDDGMLHKELSPRNLIRSLSAPVSGTSFGKLLLEDRHILTGAHIRRKHEALEHMTMELKKRKKERFNIKEKVSNFRYSLTLRGRLFGRKLQSKVESHGFEQDFVKDITSGPTIVRNLSERHIMENSTEVPPSPASVCSSAQEEFWRPMDYLSPDITPLDDSSSTQVFKEISSNLNELRRQLSQLESNQPEDLTIEQEPNDCIMDDLEDKIEVYIRDLLVASGFYDGSCEKCLSRWDPLAKPISNSVFENVEESYKKLAKEIESNTKEHKMLYDLLNEALSTVLGPPVTMSRFRRKLMSSSILPPLHGRRLLNCVMEIIRANLNSPEDKSYHSLDSMVARHLGSTPWSGLIDDEVNGVGKEIECMIVGDLIKEIVNDISICNYV